MTSMFAKTYVCEKNEVCEISNSNKVTLSTILCVLKFVEEIKSDHMDEAYPRFGRTTAL